MAKKLVHWALETIGSSSLSSLKLPENPADESAAESVEENNSATLQYVNSQLLAHGFTHNKGLSLDGTSEEDAESVLKCLVAMLGQRMEDMTRTEELSTKIRTLSYDYERLQSMYRTSTEKAANAEREQNVHKARLATTTRTLITTTSSFKSSQAELQRTRTALQSLRATHQAELKKVEKEKDKLLEKVTKLSEHQYVTRIAGIRYANDNAINHYGVSSLGPTPIGASNSTSGPPAVSGTGDFLEVTLEESMRHRQELADENRALKTLLLRVSNDIQNVEFQARCAIADLLTVKEKEASKLQDVEEPELLTSVSLFPLSPPPPTTVSTVINSLLACLRDSLRSLADPEGRVTLDDGLTATALTSGRKSTTDNAEHAEFPGFATSTKQVNSKDKEREQEKIHHQAEVRKLTSEIERLRSELEQAQTQASTYAAQIQLSGLSKQVEAMQKPWSIYGAQPSIAIPTLATKTDEIQMDVDLVPPPQAAPVSKPLSSTVSSAKQAVNSLFRPEPVPQLVAGPSSFNDDDVFAHLPPPSPALSYIDEPRDRSPAKPIAAPVRRSPRKPKPTSPLRIGAKTGLKRKASDAASPDATKTKKAKTELPKKGSVSESVRGFGAGVEAVSSPKGRLRSRAAEKEPNTAVAMKDKGKGRATVKSSSTARTTKKPAKATKAPAKGADARHSPKPPAPLPLVSGTAAPSLPTFVLPPPSPASRLPSMHIPSEAGPSTIPSNSKHDNNPFISSDQPQTSSLVPITQASAASSGSSHAAAQQATQHPPPPSMASAPSVPAVPQTPSRRIFPSNPGKSLAPHMVHAYSPVKPSPLSRILMLADSPDSPEEPPIPQLGALMEVDEPEDLMDGLDDDDEMDIQLSPTPARRTRRFSLAEELGLSDDDEMLDDNEEEASDADEVESLIRGKGKQHARGSKPAGTKATSTRARPRANPSPGRARRNKLEDSKGRASTKSKPASPAKSVPGKAKEKENHRRSPRTRTKPSSHVRATRSSTASTAEAETVKPNLRGSKVADGGIKKSRASTRAAASKSAAPDVAPPLELGDLEPAESKIAVKLKGRSRGGPRRVPIESADAAPVIPAWRG